MAKRRPRKSKQAIRWQDILRLDALGIAFFLLGGVTLLSLLSPNNGVLSGAWLGALRVLFGVGVWFAPVWLMAIGVWLILRAAGQPTDFGWRGSLGILILYATVLGLAHVLEITGTTEGADPLALARAGQGGGLVGYVLSVLLWNGLGPVVGVIFFLLLTALAVLLMSGRRFDDLLRAAVTAWIGLEARIEKSLEKEPYTVNTYKDAANGGKRKKPPKPERAPVVEAEAAPVLRINTPPPPAPRIIGLPPAPANGHGPAADRTIYVPHWRLPRLDEVLDDALEQEISQTAIRERVRIIEDTLASFAVPARVVEVNQGPTITQFGVEPGYMPRKGPEGEMEQRKVSVKKIESLANDLALALSASPIRIEAPVPGRSIVGIEVPNEQQAVVSLRGVMESEAFPAKKGALKFALGQDVSGQSVVANLAAMPHLLIAGATGSGKSVCVNGIIACLLCTHTPDTLRFLMVDPKMVELSAFNGIPHLVSPVVTEMERAVKVLQWASSEMDRRYKLLSKAGCRNIETYNQKMLAKGEATLPYIVTIIDELADLMMSAAEEVERIICRLAQMARAVGMHLILATQRPSVDVVTGLIKANFPARIAFAVVSQTDSRVILDAPGAERLLGKGDMLLMAPDAIGLQRLQGCYVSDRELTRLVQFWRDSAARAAAARPADALAPLASPGAGEPNGDAGADDWLQAPLWEDPLKHDLQKMVTDDGAGEGGKDALYRQAVEVVRAERRASITLLQRRLRIGYARAARLVDELEANGVIGPESETPSSKGRAVLLPEADAAAPEGDDAGDAEPSV